MVNIFEGTIISIAIIIIIIIIIIAEAIVIDRVTSVLDSCYMHP